MSSVIVTGSNGGIGTAICKLLKKNGYFIIGVDYYPDSNNLDAFIESDLSELVDSDLVRTSFSDQLGAISKFANLKALVNNAAIQIISGINDLRIEDFKRTININLIAPMVLSKLTYPLLKKNKGVILNIGSIHSELTKPGFISYATSKAALKGLTKSLAVDIGQHVRINTIQPAATETEMLKAGFKGNLDALSKLKSYHPANRLASSNEIAEFVLFLISDRCCFINGASLDINGAIGSRLHDPV